MTSAGDGALHFAMIHVSVRPTLDHPPAWDDQRKEAFYGEGAETVEPGNQKAEAAEVGKETGFDVAATRVGARSGEGSEKAVI